MSAAGLRRHDDLIDLDALERWMDGVGLGAGAIERVTTLTGGSQNVLIRFTRGAREYVLRRPPVHSGPAHDDSIRREAKVLATLSTTDVPHPRLIASCNDADTLGTAFYLMEPVDGFNATDGLPAIFANDAEAQASMSRSLVDALATMSRIDPYADWTRDARSRARMVRATGGALARPTPLLRTVRWLAGCRHRRPQRTL